MGIRGFFEELKICIEGISNDTKQLFEDIGEITTETKRDIISIWKEGAPPIGHAMDKTDKLLATLNNVKEHIPDPTRPSLTYPEINKMVNSILKIALDEQSSTEYLEATHLKTNRFGYSHHALSISESEVIHFQKGEIVIDTIEDFAKGSQIQILNTPRLYSRDEVLSRAYSKLGSRDYNLLFNNCEHFVKWCLHGE